MRILEIGAGRGEVTLALAAILPQGGLLMAMEGDAANVTHARDRLRAAGYDDRVSVMAGEPARFLHKVRGPFDMIVLHPEHDALRSKARALLRTGGVLISGNRKYREKDMTTAEWLAQAKADAEKRGLPELIPMLDGLAKASEQLRAADWNDNPSTQPTSASALADFAQDKPRDDNH